MFLKKNVHNTPCCEQKKPQRWNYRTICYCDDGIDRHEIA
ncbi:Uncharacterised protein [Prevotella denticola]|uniref:Uncharacterized protein n=1 Tax=Prevotella denticola TaxID=28129 RepID=A0A379E354_9BACT|nr:Uncharacterised protein [Prevotella denticola]